MGLESIPVITKKYRAASFYDQVEIQENILEQYNGYSFHLSLSFYIFKS
ncbi:hypothetical protein [Psychrobacillus glaciei]|nr:hypothetical protein [Psychrobacillus glaciei]